MNRSATFRTLAVTALSLAAAAAAHAQGVVNVYSARHYQTDEAMYANFIDRKSVV